MSESYEHLERMKGRMSAAERETWLALINALKIARWYVADHQEAQPNEEAAGHLKLIDAALDKAK